MRPMPAARSCGAGATRSTRRSRRRLPWRSRFPRRATWAAAGFIVAYLADRREVVTVDFREMAPRSAEPADVPGRRRQAAAALSGRGLGGRRAGDGPRPGSGSRPIWQDALGRAGPPGRAAGARGLPDLGRPGRLAQSPAGRAATREAGRSTRATTSAGWAISPSRSPRSASPIDTPWKAGDRLVQPDLAATLDRIAEQRARRVLHRPDRPADRRYMAEHGGFVTLDDLKSYQAKLRPPVHTTFRGFDVFSIGPPSSGGIVLCQMLNILERFDLRPTAASRPRTLHRVTEAMRRAFFTRATQLADPDFVAIPVDELTSKAYADKLARSIGEQATPSQELAPFPIQPAEGEHTTHLSTIDQAGNAVALTYTLEDSYGAKCVVAGAGFLLNNEMGDFNLIPGRTDTARPDRHAGQPDRAPQADAQLANADPGAQGRPGAGGHRLARRPDHPQHDALGRAQPPRVRAEPPRGRRRAADPSSVVPRRPGPRGSILARGDSLERSPAMGHKLGTSEHQGNRQHDRRRSRRARSCTESPITGARPRKRRVIERARSRPRPVDRTMPWIARPSAWRRSGAGASRIVPYGHVRRARSDAMLIFRNFKHRGGGTNAVFAVEVSDRLNPATTAGRTEGGTGDCRA